MFYWIFSKHSRTNNSHISVGNMQRHHLIDISINLYLSSEKWAAAKCITSTRVFIAIIITMLAGKTINTAVSAMIITCCKQKKVVRLLAIEVMIARTNQWLYFILIAMPKENMLISCYVQPSNKQRSRTIDQKKHTHQIVVWKELPTDCSAGFLGLLLVR